MGLSRQEKETFQRYLIQSREAEIAELEKGIVLAMMQIDNMAGPNADLRILSGIRRRRAELEMEYERVKKELSDITSGILPDTSKAEQKVKQSAERLREVTEAGKLLKEKAGEDAVAMHTQLHTQLDPDKHNK
jgi:hypothetical protein